VVLVVNKNEMRSERMSRSNVGIVQKNKNQKCKIGL